MSESMLNDSLHMNNINPFWNEPPGSWSKPYNYTPSVKNIIEREPEELIVGRDPRGVEHKCKLNRPLYPVRNIDGGLWTLEDPVQEAPKGIFGSQSDMLLFWVAMLLLLVLVFNNVN